MNWLFAAICAVLATTVVFAQVPKDAMPVQLTGDWQLTVGPGI